MSNKSEKPDTSILGKMTSRPAGKRQIKPTPVLFETLINENDSDDEDEDFDVTSDDDGSRSSTNSSNKDEDETESDEEMNENEEEVNENPSQSSEEQLNMQICGVCVNRRKIDDKFDFMQCDKCKIVVHESCYGGIFLDDDTEDESKTTYWFCEPCIYGLSEPPFCEFCPSRFGAFKRSDVGGRWIHLTCALFTPTVSFSAIDILSGVSWQEVGNSIFGKRSCSVCVDRIESRLGVSTCCESGMCRDYLHATCAQKLGLLIDETDDNNYQNKESASILRYFFCKKHSQIENSNVQRKIYSIWEKQEFRRITKNQRAKPLSDDKEKSRILMFKKIEGMFNDMSNVTINIPTDAIEKSRRARFLNTSAEFFDKFSSKAQDCGVSMEDFREPFFDIKQTNTSTIPIGFSKDFINYMNARENTIIPEEEEKIKQLRETVKLTKEKQQKMSKSKEIANKLAHNETEIANKTKILENFCEILSVFVEKNELQDLLNGVLPNNKKRKRENDKTHCNIGKETKGINQEPKQCRECEENTDQHKMTECDECHSHYHIGCLNPPLTRLPKRTPTCGWICHECNESDGDDYEKKKPDNSNDSLNRTRSRRPPARHSSFYEQ